MSTVLTLCDRLYFDADSSRTYIHAYRRHWTANVAFDVMHFFLTSAIVISSAALTILIPEEEAAKSLSWYFHGGVAAVLACIAFIGVLHRGMDQHRSGIIPRSLRLAVRFLGAALIAVLPLFGPDKTTAYIGIVAAICVAIVLIETFGKLGAIRVDLSSGIDAGKRATKSHQRFVRDFIQGAIADHAR